MARRKRVEKIGFYHIVNRGVERRTIFYDNKDFEKFLEIVEDSAKVYNFHIYSFTLMNNHYHLLLETKELNLSLIMRQINSKYSMYFNNRYKRVGPLWQGRFKSWFIYDEAYLGTLLRYIEYNPIKANITKVIGEYKWSMSSYNISLDCLDFSLMSSVDLEKPYDAKEDEKLRKILNTKVEIKLNTILKKEKQPLQYIFDNEPNKELFISKAIQEGYTQMQIAPILNLSNISISKIYKIYKQKVILFEKMKKKGIFWSYSKDIEYNRFNQNIFIEYTLKYGDFDDIKLLVELFGKRVVKKVWEKSVKIDQKFIKINLMIARVFFKMDVESDYFKKVKNERFEKLKLLAS
jgi:REP element-mobilizing transposase RayT